MKAFLLVQREFEPYSFDTTEFILVTKNKEQLTKLCSDLNKKSDVFSIKEVDVFNNELSYIHSNLTDLNYCLVEDSILKKETKIEENISTLPLVNSLTKEHYNQIYNLVFPIVISQIDYQEVKANLKKINIGKNNGDYYLSRNKYYKLESTT